MNWMGKRVLVTGAGGFIGSHLTERLVELGARVRALVHYRSDDSRGWLEQSTCKDSIEIVAGDVCDRDSVRRAVQDMDVVFHLAAVIAIPYSYQAPVTYVRTNIEGTFNVLMASREYEVKRVVHTSTSEVYGSAQAVPISEAHPLQGQSPYSASKIGADKMAEAFYCSYGVPVATVRPFNTFGPRQSTRAVIPTIITQCLAGKTIRLGSLTPTRDFNYVTDTVEGFVLAADAPEAVGRTVNIGSGREISIGDLVTTIAKLVDRPIAVQSDEPRLRPEKSEVMRLLADNSLSKSLLGWKSSVSLEQGLQATIDWFKDHLHHYRPGAYTL